MAELDIGSATTTNLNNTVTDYSVDPQRLDIPYTQQGETYWDYPNTTKYLGYYKTIPELKKAIDALVIWSVGKGLETDIYTQVDLEHWTGFGVDNYQSIFENLMVQKKIFGDAFAEIIRDDKTDKILNIKPLFTGDMRVVVNSKGIIIRYEQKTPGEDGVYKEFDPKEILHLCNDRIGNEIHGVSVVEACQWVIDARNEALSDERKIKHRELALGVLYMDTDNTTKINSTITQYQNAINNGEVLVLPKDTAELKDSGVQPTDRLAWIQYLESFFYQIVGVPRVIANSSDYSEASSKVGYLTFEPIYTREQSLFETDLLIQLGITVKFSRPPSLGGFLQESDQKNTGQVGFQQSDMMASMSSGGG